MRKEPEGNPSEVVERFWLFARPPNASIVNIDRRCLEWVSEKAQAYADSNAIYPRDINKDELEVPVSEPELTLRKIDLEAVNSAKSHAEASRSHSNGFDELQIILALSGKWLIYTQRNKVDHAWQTLSSAIRTGELPYSAKVSTAKDNSNSDDKNLHVACVYTSNYLFREDVRNCRGILSEMGFKDRLYYKPDIMTHKNMYRVTGSKINHRYFG